MVVSGEVPMALTVYNYMPEQAKKKGAPIDWFAIEPAIARANAVGVARNAPHPDAALLFYEYLLTEGQPLMVAHRLRADQHQGGVAAEGREDRASPTRSARSTRPRSGASSSRTRCSRRPVETRGRVHEQHGRRRRPRRHPFREVWLITLGHSLTHWYPATFYLLLPIIGNELGLSYSQIGLIMTCQYIAGAIANVPGGMLVDTVGRKGLLMAVSLFWVGFPYLLMGFTHSYLMLLACVALVGFGNSLWHPTAIPTLARRYPERKGLVLSIHGMGGNVGDALAPLAVGSLLALLTWREVVVLNVMPGLVMALLLLVFLGTLHALGGKRAQGAPTTARCSRSPTTSAACRALFRNRSLVLLTTSSRVPLDDAERAAHLPAGVPRLRDGLLAVPGSAPACSRCRPPDSPPRRSPGHLSDTHGPAQHHDDQHGDDGAWCCSFMAFAGNSHAFIVFIAVLGFFLYAIRPVMQAWILETTPKNMGGTSIGILFGAQSLGASVAPLHRAA